MMKNKFVVTIGFCVKNAEKTVGEAMESIVGQDFPHNLTEIIVVDGYSRDKTLKIIKDALSADTMEYRVFFENKGLGTARQIVVDNSEGNYIVWVDGDMVLAKDYVRKQVEFMEQNPKVGVAGGRFMTLPKSSLVATLENIDWLMWDFESQNKTVSAPVRNLYGGTIYRVRAIREAGGFDTKIRGSGEDFDAEIRISKAGWLFYFTTQALFSDRRKNTWLELWHENFWFGYGGHYVLHKYHKSIPAQNSLVMLERPFKAFKLTRKKSSFLLPIQYVFKKLAWFSGFMKAHVEGYGHESHLDLENIN